MFRISGDPCGILYSGGLLRSRHPQNDNFSSPSKSCLSRGERVDMRKDNETCNHCLFSLRYQYMKIMTIIVSK